MSFNLSFSLADLKDLNTFLQARSYVVGECRCDGMSAAAVRAQSSARAGARTGARSVIELIALRRELRERVRATPRALAHHVSAPPFPPGYSASSTDAALYDALGKAPDAAKFPNVARFYSHIGSIADRKALKTVIGGASAGAAVAAPKAAAKKAADDEDVDLFGDDGDAAAAAVVVEKPKADEKKKEKKVVVQKTICVYEVKPMEAETEPADLEKAVRSIVMDGLQWGETFKVEEIGYGIRKLVVQFVVEDEKVSLNDLEDVLIGSTGSTIISKETGAEMVRAFSACLAARSHCAMARRL
jgi:elongation factor 1-beta